MRSSVTPVKSSVTAVADPPLSVQILSFPCSFRQKIITPPKVGALSGKSWIRHWTVKGGGRLGVHTSLPPRVRHFFLKNRQNIRWGQYKSYSGADPGFSVGASTLRRGASIIFYQKKKKKNKNKKPMKLITFWFV